MAENNAPTTTKPTTTTTTTSSSQQPYPGAEPIWVFENEPPKPITSKPKHNHHQNNNQNHHRRRFVPEPDPNQDHYRLLCPLPLTGGVIGRFGAVVKQLEQTTNAIIRVDTAVPDCEDRVIHISSDPFPKTTLENQGELHEVTFAQHGLIRVLERVLEVQKDVEGGDLASVKCRLLASTRLIGCLMGTGGKRIKQIEARSGARVWARRGDHLPVCALPDDELIQIVGDSLAVKKAVLAVTQCLKDIPPPDSAQMVGSKPVNPFGTFSDQRYPFLSHPSSLSPPTMDSSVEYAWGGRPLPPVVDMASIVESKNMVKEVKFKLISSDDKIGLLIGKGGSVVKAIEKETGASIKVKASVAGSDDRVIKVSALENVELHYSPAQSAIVRVFARCTEVGNGAGSEPGSYVSANLMVPSDCVGCLLGRGGTIVSEIRKAVRCSIWMLAGDQVPTCVKGNERVLKITGPFGNVQNALCVVAGKLRDNLLASTKAAAAWELSSRQTLRQQIPPLYQPRGLPYNGQQATLIESMDHLGLSNSSNCVPSPSVWASRVNEMGRRKSRGKTYTGRGSPIVKGGLELSSESKSAVVTNSTLEIVVPEHVMGSVYGANDSNLTRLREISGASIVVHEPHPGTTEATVVISGTPDQTQAAQSLLHAFIRGGR